MSAAKRREVKRLTRVKVVLALAVNLKAPTANFNFRHAARMVTP
jgi:hypothetical protein